MEISPEELVREARPLWFRVVFSKYSFIIIVILGLASVPVVLRAINLSEVPLIDHPFDIEEFGHIDIRDEDNARLDYEKAIAKLIPGINFFPSYEKYSDALETDWENAPQELKEWLGSNSEALELWIAGTEKPRFLIHQPEDLVFNNDLSLFDHLREIGHLARYQSQKLIAEEKLEEALDLNLAILRYSRHPGQHGELMERHQGSFAFNDFVDLMIAWSNHPKVTKIEIENAAEIIKAEFKKTSPPSVALKCNYLITRHILQNPSSYTESKNEIFLESLFTTLTSQPELSFRLLRHVYKNRLYHFDKPKQLRPSLNFFVYRSDKKDPIPDKILSPSEIETLCEESIYEPILIFHFENGIHRSANREKSLLGILKVVLAAQAYKRDFGDYPQDAKTLVNQKYLPDHPLDSLHSEKTFIKYQNSGDCVSVYSVWDSDVDEGGCTENLTDTEEGNFGYFLKKPKSFKNSETQTSDD